MGEWNLVRVDGREIGVYNRGDRLFAVRNRCPHQGARLCVEPLRGTMLPSAPGRYVPGRENSVIACPWHGWEFDVETGEMLFDTGAARLRCYDVTVEGRRVLVDVAEDDDVAESPT